MALAQRRMFAAISAMALIGLAAWGGWSQRDVINPNTVLATRADLAAIEWAAQHTPADARFLVGATRWLPSADRGTDGGWWLLPLAGRWTSTPPVIFDYGPADYAMSVQQRTKQVAQFKPGQEQILESIIEHENITFVYIRDGVGPLSRAAFNNIQRYTPIYDRDGVTILAVAART